MADAFNKFEITHELLNTYESTALTPIRFKDECLYRYNTNKAFIIANRRYLNEKIFHDKIISAFNDIKLKQYHKCGLTAVIEHLYMSIDFVLNELVDYINKSCKSYAVKRRTTDYLELVNVCDTNIKFVCNVSTLKGFRGFFKGKGMIRSLCPKLDDNEDWLFVKRENADGVFYDL